MIRGSVKSSAPQPTRPPASIGTDPQAILSTLTSITRDCIKILALDGSLISMNEAGRKLLEIPSVNQVLGTCWQNWWTGTLHDKAADAVRRAAQGEVVTFQAQAPTFTGTTRWWETVIGPVTGPDGKPTCLVSTAKDITIQKVAEQRLEFSLEERHLAMQTAEIGWWRLDLASGLVHQDERARAMFDVDGESTTLNELFSRFHPDDRERCKEITNKALDPMHGGPYEASYRVIRRDGSVRWLFSRGQPLTEGEGTAKRAIGIYGTIVDQTAIREAQEALHASETRFRQLADAMPQIVFSARPNGHVDYFNRKWYEYTGFPDDGTTGDESWVAVHEPERLEHVAAIWGEALRTGQPYEIEYRLRRHDGMWRWHLGRALPIKDADGKVIRWFGTNTDIHDQRMLLEANQGLLESERIARIEVERASRIKDEFLATLSHELRTPLNAIVGWTQILRSDPSSQEDLHHGLEIIERNTRAQAQIIEDLLDMSRIISGKIHLELTRIDLSDAIRMAIKSITPSAISKNLRIELSLDPRRHIVNADAARIQQILWNLLTNAAKFTPSGGLIRIELTRSDRHVSVSVTDTGEGIDPDFLPHVFDRFRQADPTTTRKHGGLGLGLSIVRQLTELHGGVIHAQSAGKGQGARFVVTLPVVEEESPTASKRLSTDSVSIDDEPSSLSGIRVLVVDDDEDSRTVLRRLIERAGAAVVTAKSADEALHAVRSSSPDLIVSDIGMPGRDGYALISDLRTFSQIPAIAITAYARSEDRVKAIRLGFNFHLPKPVEPAELITVIQSLMTRR